MKASTASQFSYYPLIWMNNSTTLTLMRMKNSRTLSNKINRIHDRSLRVVDNYKKATFKDLLDKDKTVSIRTRNLQTLVAAMFKVKIGESPSIMHEIFLIDNSNNYNVRKNRGFNAGNPKTVYLELKPFLSKDQSYG